MPGSRTTEAEKTVVRKIARTDRQPGYEGADPVTLSEEPHRKADECKPYSILVDIKLERDSHSIRDASEVGSLIDCQDAFSMRYRDTELLERSERTDPHLDLRNRDFLAEMANLKTLG